MPPDVIASLVGQLGAVGVLGWYCWYVTSTTLPKLVQEFREENATIRAEAKAEREHHQQLLDQAVTEQRESADKLSASISEMVAHCRSTVSARA
jgi:hypothetical protein